MTELVLPKNNKFVEKILFARYGGRAGYLEYKKSKKVADTMAENEANKIKIAGEIEEKIIKEQMDIIDELEKADRYVEYRNLYQTLTKAVPKIIYNGDELRVDEDKLKRLKDLSKEFSSDNMQEIIAGILAGEYNNPGSFSLHTMSIVKNLSKSDLELFKTISGLVIDNYYLFRDILGDSAKEIRNEFNIKYTDFLYLNDLGLLNFKDTSLMLDIIKKGEENFGQNILNFGLKRLFMRYKNKINLSIITLTNAGKEIMSLLEVPEASQKYCDWLENKVKSQNVEIEWLKTEEDLKNNK